MSWLAFLFLFVCSVSGKKGFKDWNQEYGFIDVRDGAHMFYWMFYANNASSIEEAVNSPLVIWLQGGPGASSTGFGNFFEMGPYDDNYNERSSTWAKYVNLLFIDNPVGAGFSYVKHDSYLTKTNSQIAFDLVSFTISFYTSFPQFKSTPLYIFSESYGGKMAAEFAWRLNEAIIDGRISANLSGVAMGDSWISPVETCLSWAPYLLNIGEIDENGYKAIDIVAQKTKQAVESGYYLEATQDWGDLEDVVETQSDNVDFYNILTKIPAFSTVLTKQVKRFGLNKKMSKSEEEIMNVDVRKALNITSEAVYGSMSGLVFEYLKFDFMKPVTNIVARLLSETQMSVVVYSGQLDLIVDTPGTLAWVDKLNWPGINDWMNSERTALVVNDTIEGFRKKYENFAFYWLNRAGHMSPSDNPQAVIHMLKEVTGLN